MPVELIEPVKALRNAGARVVLISPKADSVQAMNNDVEPGSKIPAMTPWPSLQTDLENAGANWVDETVVHDGKLVASRNPGDLPAFCGAIVTPFAA